MDIKMDIYTYQILNLRKVVSHGVPFLNTTVKSGDKRFAPTWDMVWGSKSKTLSHEDYEIEYRRMMKISQKENKEIWDKLIEQESIALGCYCNKDVFCHRHLLKEILEEYALDNDIDVVQMGEIE